MSAFRVADLGSKPALPVGLFTGRVMPVTKLTKTGKFPAMVRTLLYVFGHLNGIVNLQKRCASKGRHSSSLTLL